MVESGRPLEDPDEEMGTVLAGAGGSASGSAAIPQGSSRGSAAQPPWGMPTRAERGLEPRKPWRKRGGQKQSDEYNRHMAALHRQKGKGKGKCKGN